MPRGRPLKEDAKRRQVRVRLTEEEYQLLKNLSTEVDIPMSKIVIDGVRLLDTISKNNDPQWLHDHYPVLFQGLTTEVR